VLAVEASRLARDERGIGRYVRALLPRIVALRAGVRLVLFVKGGDVARLAAAYAAHPSTRGRVEVRPLRAMRRTRADVYWYPWNVARPTPRHGVVVATVHDIAPIAAPAAGRAGWGRRRRDRRWRRLYAETVGRATLLIVDSAFTGAELRRVFGVRNERVRVVPLAADDAPAPPPGGDGGTLARLGVRRPFVLAVGADEPRKNHEVLERAMPRVAAQLPEATLVLAGPRRTGANGANGADGADGAGARWRRTLGYVSDADLAVLYRTAGCLVVPSTYEGFGLPVLEAMRLGTPVVCARRASLPEVGGDAAAWVEPDDDAQVAATITRVLTDGGARDAMRAAGLAHSARFTWDATARLTLDALEQALALGERRSDAPSWRRWMRWLGAFGR
jgi:glycosyltransferase involved in cell wall biosynthesis